MGPNPRVCILTETFYPVVGGGETQAKSLADGLAGAGFAVIVMARRTDSRLKKCEQLGSVTVYRLGPTGRQHLMKWGLLFTSLLALVRLRRHYDLVFVSGFRVLGIAAVLAGRLLDKPVVLKADNNGEMSGAFFTAGLARFGLSTDGRLFCTLLGLRNALLRRAHRFVALSTDIRDELLEHGAAPEQISLIPNSVDAQVYRSAAEGEKRRVRAALGLPSDALIVMYTGRLVSYKGLPLLLQVWEEMARRYDHVYLVLVGAGSMDIHNCEAELKEYVADRCLADRVLFAGEVTDVSSYLQAADIYVFPTKREAFGIALIEAMACELPVIATPVGGIKDIIIPDLNGILVQPGNFSELCRALDHLIVNSDLRRSLGQAARQTVLERYAVESVVDQYIELFTSYT